jgi:hypothetical protein
MRQPLRSQIEEIIHKWHVSGIVAERVLRELPAVERFLAEQHKLRAGLFDALLGDDGKSIDLYWEGEWKGRLYTLMINFSEEKIAVYGCRPRDNGDEDEIYQVIGKKTE